MSQPCLRLKMQANRKLATALTDSLNKIHADHLSTIDTIKLGGKRIINYGSFFPNEYYRNSCRETWKEDSRLALNLGEIYKRNDIALEMLYFLIEPQISEIIDQVNSGDNNEEKIAAALYEILKK